MVDYIIFYEGDKSKINIHSPKPEYTVITIVYQLVKIIRILYTYYVIINRLEDLKRITN